ncbi:MAG: hypothetical protein WBB39_03005 [Candidatus Saccharimonadales bacterium]
MSSFSYPAAKPPVWRIKVDEVLPQAAWLHCSYRLNGEGLGTDYSLYANTLFQGVTETNDPTGVIHQLVTLALQRGSGVGKISVRAYRLQVTMSNACSSDDAANMLRQAVLRAGLGSITIG